MPDMPCLVCGTARYVKDSDLKYGRGKYCSQACYRTTRTTRVELPCATCGRAFIAFRSKLAKGNGKYCSRACTADGKRKDNAVKSHPLYESWRSMKRRCQDPSNQGYASYGGRGITVCERWLSSFAAFVEDMGARPEGMTLDRIDTDGNYEPTNCRWATVKTQAENRRSSIVVEHNGEAITLTAYAKARGVQYSALHRRIRYRGETPEAAANCLISGKSRSRKAAG